MKIEYYDTFLKIHTDRDPDLIWKVKQLAGRYYDPGSEAWIVPIRPGLAEAVTRLFGFDLANDLILNREADFMEAISPPPPGSVDPWKVPAGVAVELAVDHHFYTVHFGDRDDYIRIHAPYIRGE